MSFSYATAPTPSLTLSESPTSVLSAAGCSLSLSQAQLQSCLTYFKNFFSGLVLVFWDGVNIYWPFFLLFLKCEKKNEKKNYHKQKLKAHLCVIGEQKRTSLQLNQGLLTENKDPQLWEIQFCVSFGGFLPRMSPLKPHTPHMSFISLSSSPFSPLGDDHHICCHLFCPRTRQNPWAGPTLCRGLWSRAEASACAGIILLSHLPPTGISTTGTMLPRGPGNVDWWPGDGYGVHKTRSVGDSCVLLPQADTPKTLLGRNLMHLSPSKKQRNTRVLLRIWIHFQKLLMYLRTTGLKQLNWIMLMF